VRHAFLSLLVAVILAACAPSIRHEVLTPPPSSPRAEFFLEKPEVLSREVGDEAWRRNEQLSESMARLLRDSLAARGKILAALPIAAIRSRIYLGFGDAPARAPGKRRPLAYIEVRLELLEARRVRYSTHTRTKIKPSLFGLGPDVEEIIQDTLRQAAEDFVSRL
jgi:hypothetical protein